MARYARRRPYRRRPSTRLRRSTTARPRRYRRSRPRNNVNQLTMRAPLASRLLRVKLPWVKTFEHAFTVSSSQSWAFQGNGIVPYTSTGQSGANLPSAGDTLPAGEVEYSRLYDKYFINGSSINVEIVSTQNTPNGTVRFVLLAIPFNDLDDSWQNNKAQLDGYTYEQLLAWPYAKWRMIGSNLGGASRLVTKMFRKTKNMCGIKDLRDNSQYGANLTDGTTLAPSANPGNGFMYYIRMFNTSSNATPTIDMTVRMSLYVTMTNREFNPTVSITS